jgi:mRNA interferase MazF
VKRGEVWWVNFEPSVGSEIRKVKPAVIVINNSATPISTVFRLFLLPAILVNATQVKLFSC